jgi:hypothetical protein
MHKMLSKSQFKSNFDNENSNFSSPISQLEGETNEIQNPNTKPLTSEKVAGEIFPQKSFPPDISPRQLFSHEEKNQLFYSSFDDLKTYLLHGGDPNITHTEVGVSNIIF